MVKIGYSASTGFVRVAIDEKNTGNFHICLNERVDLSPNWWRNARISVSAATGQLADNHDILAVETTQGVGDPDLVAVSASHEEAAAEKEDTELVQELLRENGVEVRDDEGSGASDGADGDGAAAEAEQAEARVGAQSGG